MCGGLGKTPHTPNCSATHFPELRYVSLLHASQPEFSLEDSCITFTLTLELKSTNVFWCDDAQSMIHKDCRLCTRPSQQGVNPNCNNALVAKWAENLVQSLAQISAGVNAFLLKWFMLH